MDYIEQGKKSNSLVLSLLWNVAPEINYRYLFWKMQL